MLQLPNAVAVTVPDEAMNIEISGKTLTYECVSYDQPIEEEELPDTDYTHFKRATELSEAEYVVLTPASVLYSNAKASFYSLLRSKGYEPESTLIIFKK